MDVSAKTDGISEPRASDQSRTTSALGNAGALFGILAATWIVFAPALKNEFVNYDDDKIIVLNPNIRGLGTNELRWMFSTLYMCHYQPLGWLSYAVDYALWGLDPRGFILTNLLIHMAAALGVYAVANDLLRTTTVWNETEARVGATIAALFFAIHPLRVESVAWASERRDVLSGLFFVLSVLFYLRYCRKKAGGGSAWVPYVASLVACAASFLSKATGVGLPVVLLVLDWYPLRRWPVRFDRTSVAQVSGLVREKLPYLVMAAITAAIAVYAQRRSDTIASLVSHGLAARVACAAVGLCFYVWKTLAPLGLSPLVPMPDAIDPLSLRYSGCTLFVLATGLILFIVRRRFPAGLAAAVCYVTLLLPVLGLLQIGPQIVADRYTYLACLGFAILVGAIAVGAWRWAVRSGWPIQCFWVSAAVVMFLTLGSLTRSQIRVWHDSIALWSRVLEKFPESAHGHTGLGTALGERGRALDAMPHFRRALTTRPNLVEANYGLGLALLRQNRHEEAAEWFEKTLAIKPSHAASWNNLGVMHLLDGRFEQAVETLGRANALDPRNPETLYNLGQALAADGRADEAIVKWREVVTIVPQSPMVLETLAWYLATSPEESVRDGSESLRLAEEAVRLTAGENPGCLDALSAAYAELGRFDRAEETAREAIRVAKALGMNDLSGEIEQRRTLYQSETPFRFDATARRLENVPPKPQP